MAKKLSTAHESQSSRQQNEDEMLFQDYTGSPVPPHKEYPVKRSKQGLNTKTENDEKNLGKTEESGQSNNGVLPLEVNKEVELATTRLYRNHRDMRNSREKRSTSKTGGLSATIPGQSFTTPKAVERMRHGIAVPGKLKNTVSPIDADQFGKMDPVDRLVHLKQIAANASDTVQRAKDEAQQRAKEKTAAVLKAKQDEIDALKAAAQNKGG